MTPLDAARARMDGLVTEAEVCRTCGSRSVGLCAPLDAAALDDMSGETERVTLAPRAALFRQGDPATHVYTLTDGAARLTRVLPDGRQAAIGFRIPGDIMGFTPGAEHAFGAETLIGATVCRLDRRRLDALFRRYPVLERRFLELCARTGRDPGPCPGARPVHGGGARRRLPDLARRAAGAPWPAGPVFDLPVTRADIGEFLGLTLETVSRSVSAFRKRGWIRLHGQSGVELTNRAALAALAAREGEA